MVSAGPSTLRIVPAKCRNTKPASSIANELIVLGPAFQRTSFQGAPGRRATPDLMSRFHAGYRSIAVRTPDCLHGGADYADPEVGNGCAVG